MSALLSFGLLLATQAIPAIDSAPDWTMVAEVRFGSIDVPETALSTIRAAAVDAQERLILAQLYDSRVRIYDLDGTRVGSIGRPGNGPQDLAAPVDVGVVGDTIWVADSRASSLKFFRGDGTWLGSVTIAHVAGPGIFASAGYPLDNGSILAKPGVSMESLVGQERQIPWIRFDREAQLVDTLLLDNRLFSVARLQVDGGTTLLKQPFDESDRVAVFPDGSGVVRVVQASDGADRPIRVQVLDADGHSVFARDYAVTRRRLTDDIVDRSINRYMEAVERTMASSLAFNARKFRVAYSDAIRRPDFIPPVEEVHVGSDGTIWIGREAAGRDSQRWIAIDGRSGDLAGQIRLPRDSRLIASSTEFVWAEELDELDVVHVQRYRIIKS